MKKMHLYFYVLFCGITIFSNPSFAETKAKEPALVVVMTRMPQTERHEVPPLPPNTLKEIPTLRADPTASLATSQKISADVAGIMRHVYLSNPTLLSTRAELQAVHEKYPQALSGYRPTVSIESTLYNKDVNSKYIGPYDGTTTTDAMVSVSQPLYRGGRTMAEVDKANSMIKAAFAGLRQGEQSIFLQTVIAIADMVRDRSLLNLRENNVTLLTEELKAAKARMEAGELTTTDSKQAEARLARAVSERIFTANSLDSSSADFEQLVGYAPPDNLQFPDLIFTFPSSHAEMIAWAEKNNPEIEVAERTHSVANHDIDAIFRELFPQISAFATVSTEHNPQPGGVNDVGASTIGLRASIPLYDAGMTRSRVREAKNTARQREFEIEETKRRIVQKIMGDSNNLLSAQAEIIARISEIDAAQAAREGVGAEAHLGGRTVLDVLDADQELLDAKAARIIAERNEIVNHYSLAADLGLLSPEQFGLQDIAYDPGPHYRTMGKRVLSMNPDMTEDEKTKNSAK